MSKILLTVNGSTFSVTLEQAQEMFTRLETEIPRLRRERAGMIRDEIKDLQRELETLEPTEPTIPQSAKKEQSYCGKCGRKKGFDANGLFPRECQKQSHHCQPAQPPHPMPDLIGCEALQYSDQMVCKRCNHTWDVNDTYPPACKGILKSAK